MHRFQLIEQSLNSKSFFGLRVVTNLFQIGFPTKKFLAKIMIKMHRFQRIDQKLNSKGLLRLPLVARLFTIQIPTKKFIAKIIIKMQISNY